MKSGRLTDAKELDYSGRPILDTFEDGSVYLQSHLPAYSRIFASPAVKRDSGGGISVAWYSDLTGTPQKWGDVDPASRNRVSSILGGLVSSMLKLSEDPADEMAQILTRWLQVLSLRDDLFVIDGQPVLTNWGIVPEAVGDDPEALLRHFQSGLGQFLREDAPDRARLDSVANIAAHPQSQTPAMDASAPQASLETVEDRRDLRASAWSGILPIGIACIVALFLLLFMLLPGVLVYPRSVAIDQASLEQAEEVLRQRVEQMRTLVSQAVCRPPEQQSRLEGVPNELSGAAPDISGGPAATAAPPQQTSPGLSLLPTAPAMLKPPGQSNASSIVELVERATVLVVARERDGKTSTGTGFFVAPHRIVTNRHVIEDADPNAIHVTSAALSGVRKVSLQGMTDTSDFGASDFALLGLEDGASPPPLTVTTAAAKGDNVLAAGFPSVFMETDPQFQALLQGEASSAPAMVLTQGIVTVFQTSPSGVPLVLHSADISPGNSGGPLIDYCGRVVGVNTFLRTDSTDQMRLNFALKADSLLGFLKSGHVEIQAPGEACAPVAAAQSPADLQFTGR